MLASTVLDAMSAEELLLLQLASIRLVDYRKCSQVDMALRCGVSQAIISLVENGYHDRVCLATLCRIVIEYSQD